MNYELNDQREGTTWKAKQDNRRPCLFGGFLLLEVLITLTIVSVAFTSLLHLIGRSLSMAALARHLAFSQELIEQKLFELRTENELSETSETFADEENTQYQLTVSLEEIQEHDEPRITLHKASLEVVPQTRNARTVKVETIIAKPIKEENASSPENLPTDEHYEEPLE